MAVYAALLSLGGCAEANEAGLITGLEEAAEWPGAEEADPSFTLVVPPEVDIPEVGDETVFSVVIAVTNPRRSSVKIDGLDTLTFSVRAQNGSVLKMDGGRDGVGRGLSIFGPIAPGASATMEWTATLMRSPDGLELLLEDGLLGAWIIRGLGPGHHELMATYSLENTFDRGAVPIWIGEAVTPLVRLTLTEHT